MTNPITVALERLDASQREAVTFEGNSVVLAGPGSGKTATLVAKAGLLHERVIAPARGLLCLTYSRDAVGEFTVRLRGMGLRQGRRLFVGTVHSFCLRMVLEPYADLAGHPHLAGIRVARPSDVQASIAAALDAVGVNEDPRRYGLTLTRFRRARAAGEPLDGFADDDEAVANAYERELSTRGLVDFDGMVSSALGILEANDWVRDLIVARFPWLLVDEYQDLGAPLHKIVLLLVEAGAHVFAVGDPDQNIYAFSGSNPRYLLDLANDTRFQVTRLPFNYRSGRRLIAASEAALGGGVTRGYRPGENVQNHGEIYVRETDDGFDAQAKEIATTVIPNLRAIDIPLHEIAILYRQRGALVDTIETSLRSAGIDFHAERSDRWPRGPIIEWLQAGAEYAISGAFGSSGSFRDLSDVYLNLRQDVGAAQTDKALVESLQRVGLAFGNAVNPETRLDDWLRRVLDSLALRDLLATNPEYADDTEALEAVMTKAGDTDATIREFAELARHEGRVVLTTYHGSKGREFDAVILPGLQDSLMPQSYWDRGRGRRMWSAAALAEDRRLFYVGLTRARKVIFLIWSHAFTNPWGYADTSGQSRFVAEVEARLAEVDAA